MVRADDVDPGLWKGIAPPKLIVPLDVHMARLCRILSLHDSDTISQSTAVQVTERFAAIAPADPVKYDFALSRIGILDNCTGHRRSDCQSCELLDVCRRRDRAMPSRSASKPRPKPVPGITSTSCTS
jgi:endonuclease III